MTDAEREQMFDRLDRQLFCLTWMLALNLALTAVVFWKGFTM